MEKIIIVVEKSKDYYDAYSENCDGIYAAGGSIEDVKKDVESAIAAIKNNLPREQWPDQIKSDYEIEYKLDVQSFLEYYKGYMSLSGLEKITGINQKQLSNYLNNRSKPRRKQVEKINVILQRSSLILHFDLLFDDLQVEDAPCELSRGVFMSWI